MQFSLESLEALSFQVLCMLLNMKFKGSEKCFMDFSEVSVIKLVMLIMYIYTVCRMVQTCKQLFLNIEIPHTFCA